MRRDAFNKLQEAFHKKLTYKELKKDPLLIATRTLDEGLIYFEYLEEPGEKLPWGAFLVHNLGVINGMPSSTSEQKEVETIFINFGFHDSIESLLSQIKKFMSVVENISKNV